MKLKDDGYDDIRNFVKEVEELTKPPKMNHKTWDTIEDILFSLHIRFCPLFETGKKGKITQVHCNAIKDKLRRCIKSLLKEQRRELLKELKEKGETK